MNTTLISDNRVHIELLARGGRDLCVVFASAGNAFGGTQILEFSKTLASLDPSDFDICWVIDKEKAWFTLTTDSIITAINKVREGYRHAFTIGESMGGSGALFFHEKLKASRSLAFSPQFSMKKPFINFNTDIGPPSRDMNLIKFFGSEIRATQESSLIIYGDASWQDLVHSLLYRELGYDVAYLQGSGHAVAQGIKQHGKLNATLLFFLDPSIDAWQERVKSLFGTALIHKNPINRINF